MAGAKISVVICTHNPRQDYLARTLDSLRMQDLARSDWELVLIDNASENIIGDEYFLAWHPNARIVRENKVGLVHARIRAFRETATPLIIFSDDDNVMKSDYLGAAWNIYNRFPQMGAYGACINCEYEEPIQSPRDFIDVFSDPNGGRGTNWSNDMDHRSSTPIGAGLCVRREVANHYLVQLTRSPEMLQLGRKGGRLLSYEDTDIVSSACRLGFGKGIFSELKIVHLISSNRTAPDYLLRLAEGHAYSEYLFGSKNGSSRFGEAGKFRKAINRLRLRGFRRQLYDAAEKGRKCAARDLARGTPE